MRIVAVASQKGGVGKTTLAGHIAVQAERDGAGPVALVDTDPQGSLAEWWNDRKAVTPVFAQTSILQLNDDIDRMRELGIALLIIDTPPAITSTIGKVIETADLVVIPTRPSPHDLRSGGQTGSLVAEMEKPVVFVVNNASSRANITVEAVIALSQFGTLAPAIIHQRTDFASSMIDGRTVMEIPRKSPSSEEIAKLWAYLDDRLDRIFQPEAMPPFYSLGSAHGRA